MDSQTIEKIIKSTSVGQKYFQGCFAADKIPTKFPKYPIALIVNEDKSNQYGSHWVSIFIKNLKYIYYFDSLGKEHSVPLIDKYLNRFQYCVKNKNSFQNILNKTCGHYCIFFVILISLDIPFNVIINLLSNQTNPDLYVYNFVKCLYQIKSCNKYF